MKNVFFSLQQMTPEKLNQNPITVHHAQKLDTDEGESSKDEDEFTTFQEMSEENSTSDIPMEGTEGSKPAENEDESEAIEIQQVHNVLNRTTHGEKHTFDQNSVTEIEV